VVTRSDGARFSRRLKLVSPWREFTEGGALASYGAGLVWSWERAASFVDRVLKGADPATMLIEQPTGFELVINQRIARTLDLVVSPLLLARADEVIE